MDEVPFIDEIIQGDALETLKKLPQDSIDVVLTSPPYFHQRDYGQAKHMIGQEKTVDEYIDAIGRVFKECLRVIKPEGSIFFNLGDKYQNDSLSLIPYRFAIRMLDETMKAERKGEGIRAILLNDITWVKPNPQPRQFKRRLVNSTEPFFHFVKSACYKYFPERYMASPRSSNKATRASKIGQSYIRAIVSSDLKDWQKQSALKELDEVIREVREGKIWSFRMKIRGIHSAAYGGYEGGRKGHIETKGYTIIRMSGESLKKDSIEAPILSLKYQKHPAIYPEYIVTELLNLVSEPNDIIVDPFVGSGTTAVVAQRMRRHFIGVELVEEFRNVAMDRLKQSKTHEPSVLLYGEKGQEKVKII